MPERDTVAFIASNGFGNLEAVYPSDLAEISMQIAQIIGQRKFMVFRSGDDILMTSRKVENNFTPVHSYYVSQTVRRGENRFNVFASIPLGGSAEQFIAKYSLGAADPTVQQLDTQIFPPVFNRPKSTRFDTRDKEHLSRLVEAIQDLEDFETDANMEIFNQVLADILIYRHFRE